GAGRPRPRTAGLREVPPGALEVPAAGRLRAEPAQERSGQDPPRRPARLTPPCALGAQPPASLLCWEPVACGDRGEVGVRRGMLLLVAMALLVPGAGCGRDRTRVVRGVAFLEPHTVDFGRVGLGTTTTRTVELKNQARAPYRILGWELDGLGEDFA